MQVTLKQLKPIFKFIARGYNGTILNNILVASEGIKITDLESTLLIKDDYNLGQGLHVLETIGLVDAYTKDISDYPYERFNYSSFKGAELPMSCFIETIKDIHQYASKDETRQHLNGIAFDSGHIIATDGHCLKAVKIVGLEGSYILPSKGIDILLKLAAKYKLKNVMIELSDNLVMIDNEFFTLTMRPIDREYVKWKAIIPTKWNSSLDICEWINFKELKPLFDRRHYKCEIVASEGCISLVVAGQNYIIGNCDDELLVRIGFNGSFLDKAIGKDRHFTLKYNNEITPCLVNGVIIMPLKV